MTDIAQGSLAPPLTTPQPPRAPAQQTALFHPLFDFLTLGGGSLIACAVLAALFPRGIAPAQQGALIAVLMFAINQPHFAHSYQLFYRDFGTKAFGASHAPALRLRYVFAGLIVPVVLTAFLAGAILSRSARALGLGANLMFFLVGWHYVKQGYGILMVDSAQKRLFFSDRAKKTFRANGYACWMLAWLAVNHAAPKVTHYLGIPYVSFPLPTILYQAAVAVAVCTTAATIMELVQRWREAGRTLPWNGVIAYVTTLYLWIVFVRFNPLVAAVVPTFHSLQYLAVVWRYQLNAADGEPNRIPALRRFLRSRWRSFAWFVGVGILLGYLAFAGVPRLLDADLPYDRHAFGPTLFLFSFYILINVHHYFMDNVMWRRGNPDVQRYLFARK